MLRSVHEDTQRLRHNCCAVRYGRLKIDTLPHANLNSSIEFATPFSCLGGLVGLSGCVVIQGIGMSLFVAGWRCLQFTCCPQIHPRSVTTGRSTPSVFRRAPFRLHRAPSLASLGFFGSSLHPLSLVTTHPFPPQVARSLPEHFCIIEGM